mmetsp:Transcript_17428/g.53994  ORF Transcript_17428/g.53994 Transcript_17428/m.53994 type:complete len:214 (+) Transcript_17428:344-985(+)
MYGLSAVTSIRLEFISSSMRARLASMPTTQLSEKLTQASLSSRMDCRLLKAINGFATLSSKCEPVAPPSVTPMSLPITCAQTIITASLCVGLTLPGMIDEPGSLAGRMSSPSPARGPLPSMRTSLAILSTLSAMVFRMPASAICASCAASDSNLLGADEKGNPVSAVISLAASSAKSGCELSPVPTAVPPSASSSKCTMAPFARSTELRICCT